MGLRESDCAVLMVIHKFQAHEPIRDLLLYLKEAVEDFLCLVEHDFGVSDCKGIVDVNCGDGVACCSAVSIYGRIRGSADEATGCEFLMHVLVSQVGTLFDPIEILL